MLSSRFPKYKSNLQRIAQERFSITLKQENVNNEEVVEATSSIDEDAASQDVDTVSPEPTFMVNRYFDSLPSKTDRSDPSMRVVVGESSRVVLPEDSLETDEYSRNVDVVEEQATMHRKKFDLRNTLQIHKNSFKKKKVDLRIQLKRNNVSHHSIIAHDFSPAQTVMMTPLNGFNNGELNGQFEVMHRGGVRSRREQFDHERSSKEIVFTQDMYTRNNVFTREKSISRNPFRGRSRTRSRSRLRLRGSSKARDRSRSRVRQYLYTNHFRGPSRDRSRSRVRQYLNTNHFRGSSKARDRSRSRFTQNTNRFRATSKSRFTQNNSSKIQFNGGFDKSRLGVRQRNGGESQNYYRNPPYVRGNRYGNGRTQANSVYDVRENYKHYGEWNKKKNFRYNQSNTWSNVPASNKQPYGKRIYNR